MPKYLKDDKDRRWKRAIEWRNKKGQKDGQKSFAIVPYLGVQTLFGCFYYEGGTRHSGGLGGLCQTVETGPDEKWKKIKKETRERFEDWEKRNRRWARPSLMIRLDLGVAWWPIFPFVFPFSLFWLHHWQQPWTIPLVTLFFWSVHQSCLSMGSDVYLARYCLPVSL